jgi:hypothetical protein
MLQSLSQLLADTPGAVGSFSVVDLGMAQAVVAAAEQSGRPAVVGVATRHWHVIDALRLTPSLLASAEAAAVPIALHLDHAGREELDIIRAALDAGFTSIMIDASKLAFADNSAVTLEVCGLASGYGASVEAELGAISGEEGVAGLVDPDFDESMFTRSWQGRGVRRTLPDRRLGGLDRHRPWAVPRAAEASVRADQRASTSYPGTAGDARCYRRQPRRHRRVGQAGDQEGQLLLGVPGHRDGRGPRQQPRR